MAGKSNTSLYLFYDHIPIASPLSYSVYKIELDLKNTTSSRKELDPIVQFPRDGKYPTYMRCAYLGSKLYFLGGIRRDLLKLYKNGDDVFPRDVYVLDTKTNKFNKMDASLNTGKPDACVFAAANGKLYVLASIFLPTIPCQDLSNVSHLLPSIHLFECFDPITNEWKVLNNPPGERDVYWEGFTLLDNRRKVVLLGWEPHRDKKVRFVYDVNDDTWTRSDLTDPNVTLLDAATDDDFYYGLCRFEETPFKYNSDIITCDDELELSGSDDSPVGDVDDGLVEMSSISQQPYFGYTSTFLRYVGGGYFCFIAAGMLPHPDHQTPNHLGYCPPDEHNRAISIVLFKTERDGSKAQIMASQEYVMPAPFYNNAELAECMLVTPEQMHKPKRNRKKKNRTVGDGVSV